MKTKKVENMAPEATEEVLPVEKKPKVTPFTGDFGRVDLNTLRDKLNEVIDYLNK